VISKIFICPFFGDLPPWYEHWESNSEHLRELGYEFLFDNDEMEFRTRVHEKLGIVCPPLWGTGKMWDFRPALGLLYEDEIAGFDFWGHTDFDVVYGRVDQWVTNDFLQEIDMHSNCFDYVNGSWSLYRNTEQMRDLFMQEPLWREIMESPAATGWAEKEFSKLISHAHEEGSLVKAWTQWQVFTEIELANLRWDGEKLMCGENETMMAHFRRTKVFPRGCVA
jgi:hypothetical protein